MRKQSIIASVALVAIAVAGCNNRHQDELVEVATGYIQAMADYRIEDARPFATPETSKSTIDFLLNTIMPKLDSSYIQQNIPAEITIESVEWLTDTSAVVHYRKSTPLQSNMAVTLEMRRRDGAWKAYQVIKPSGILGGRVGALDTAEMRRMRLENPDSVPDHLPKRPIKL